MSQRLLNHPTIIDPSTGEPLCALMLIGNMPVWPQMGGQDETEGGSDQGDDTSQGEEGQSGSEAESDDTKQTGDDTVSRQEHESVINRMKAADRRASAAEEKIKQFELAGKSELEKAQAERDDAVKDREGLREQLQSERLSNAFLAVNDVTWVDREDALAMLRAKYMDGVEISEDGKIKGMKEAIKKMAKEKSYLVDSGSSASSTGDAMNGKRKGDDKSDKAARDAELAKRMPALGRRM